MNTSTHPVINFPSTVYHDVIFMIWLMIFILLTDTEPSNLASTEHTVLGSQSCKASPFLLHWLWKQSMRYKIKTKDLGYKYNHTWSSSSQGMELKEVLRVWGQHKHETRPIWAIGLTKSRCLFWSLAYTFALDDHWWPWPEFEFLCPTCFLCA